MPRHDLSLTDQSKAQAAHEILTRLMQVALLIEQDNMQAITELYEGKCIVGMVRRLEQLTEVQG